METGIVKGLYASAPQELSFAPEITVRAFLLQRKAGNLLMYSVGGLSSETQSIENLGGIWRHYLNHWHEAGIGCDEIENAYKAPLVCHENEKPEASKHCTVAETFSERHTASDDFEVIPIPGHTSGATAYLWDNGENRCFFTGDSLYLKDGEWRAAVLESSDRERYIESLELIKGLDFDILIPWASSADQPFLSRIDRNEKAQRIDVILQRLRAGDDH